MRRWLRDGARLASLALLLGAPALAEEHVVQPGETLWQIAAQVAGDPEAWPLLYRANRDQIKDPSVLHPGQVLVIPEFEPSSGAPSRRSAVSTGPSTQTPPAGD